MWFTDKDGNKINTENSKSGINSSQFHDKGSDVIEESMHNKELESGTMQRILLCPGCNELLEGSKEIKSHFEKFPKHFEENKRHNKDLDFVGELNDNKNLEIISDWGTETMWKVKDVTATPGLDDKEVPSDLYVKVLNMYEATGDAQFKEEPYFAELILLPKMNQLSDGILESVASSAGMSVKELKKQRSAPMDIVTYGYSIRLAEKSGSDAKKLRDELAKSAPAHAAMIGFDLDKRWNGIGNNGWDTLEEMTTGHKISMEEVFKRNRG